MPEIYEGTLPYIFISYSHKDSRIVRPIIQMLSDRGYRIWYDKGIKVGTEWADYIADHVEQCKVFLAFISHNSVESEHCKDELSYAKEYHKVLFNIFLEDDVNRSSGMRMQTNRFQHLSLRDFGTTEALGEEICAANQLVCCKKQQKVKANKYVSDPVQREPESAAGLTMQTEQMDRGGVPQPEVKVPQERSEMQSEEKNAKYKRTAERVRFGDDHSENPESEQSAVSTNTQAQQRKQSQPASKPKAHVVEESGVHISPRLAVLLELSYSVVGAFAMREIFAFTNNGWARFGLMIIPHIAIALLVKIIFWKAKSDDQIDAWLDCTMLLIPSTILSIIISMFMVAIPLHFFVKLLIVVGLNIVPVFGAWFVYESIF